MKCRSRYASAGLVLLPLPMIQWNERYALNSTVGHHVLPSQSEGQKWDLHQRETPQRPAISTCWSSSPAALGLVFCQMPLQQTFNTTDTSGLIIPSSTPKRSSGRMASTQSLNHLLNFTLPPRQSPQSIPRRSRRTNGSSQVWNKERESAAIWCN